MKVMTLDNLSDVWAKVQSFLNLKSDADHTHVASSIYSDDNTTNLTSIIDDLENDKTEFNITDDLISYKYKENSGWNDLLDVKSFKQTVLSDVLTAIFDTYVSLSAKKTKTTYLVGETFNINDITVSLNYKNGGSRDVSGFIISPSNVDTSSPKIETLTITYTIENKTLTAYMPIVVATEEGILYELPEEKKFVSADRDYVDTNLRLLTADIDFTLMIDFNGSRDNTSNANSHCLFHCMTENKPYPGISMSIWTINYGFNIYDTTNNSLTVISGDKKNISYNNTDRHKVYLSKPRGSNTYTIKIDDCLGTMSATYFQTIDDTLLLGCYQLPDGTKGRFWNGTIHDCKVWNKVLSESEMI